MLRVLFKDAEQRSVMERLLPIPATVGVILPLQNHLSMLFVTHWLQSIHIIFTPSSLTLATFLRENPCRNRMQFDCHFKLRCNSQTLPPWPSLRERMKNFIHLWCRNYPQFNANCSHVSNPGDREVLNYDASLLNNTYTTVQRFGVT